MTFDPAAALIAYHKALDAHDMAAIGEFLAGDASYSSGGLGVVQGKAAILASVERYFATSPDHQAWDDNVMAVSDLVAKCEWRLRATNKTTGEVVERHGVETIVFNGLGRIVSVVVEDLG